jgi:hypothetical protein
VGQFALRARLTGPCFNAQVAAVVGLVEAPVNHRKSTTLVKEVKAIKYGNTTGISITKIFESPFAGKHPKLISKGTKATAAEAAVTAAETIAVVDLEEAKRLAAKLGALGGAIAIVLTQEAEPGGPFVRLLARTRATPRVGGPLDQLRGFFYGPHGRYRRGG